MFFANKLEVSQEAVRKWFTGDARPKTDKIREIASILEVDEAWLALGIKPEMDRREKRVHHEKTEGAVYLLFGLVTMAGGHCAFPGKGDARSDYVDFYAIIGGMQMAVHASVGRELSKNSYQFVVPREYRDVRCLGVVHNSALHFTILDLKSGLIDSHRQRKAGEFILHIHKSGSDYTTGDDVWPRLHSLGDLR